MPHQCQAQLLKSQAEAVLRHITRFLAMAGPSESLLIKNFLNVHLHLFQMSLSLVCICWVGAVVLQIYPIQKVTEIYNKVTEPYNIVSELENSCCNILCLLWSKVAYIGMGHILP